MGKFQYKLREIEFIDPRPEKEMKSKKQGGEIIYVEDPRVPEGLLKKIERTFGSRIYCDCRRLCWYGNCLGSC